MKNKSKKKFSKADKICLLLLILATLVIIHTIFSNSKKETIEQPNFLINNSTETTVHEVSTPIVNNT